MTYSPLTESQLHALGLTSYRSRLPSADTREGGEIWARAWVLATIAAQLAWGLRFVEDQLFPDTADEANLERWGLLYEVDRLEPTTAVGELGSGAVQITGTSGTPIPTGMVFVGGDGTTWTNTTGGTMGGSGSIVALSASEPGSAGNLPAGTALTIQSPPAGIDAAAEVVTELTGGTDQETLQAWAARIVERIRAGNGANTQADYERWATEVDGCIEAHCLPLRRGPGTVTVAAFEADADGNRHPAGPTLRGLIATHIDERRPVTAEVDIVAATEVALNVSITSLEVEPGYEGTEVAAEVEAAIEAWIWALRTGDTAYLTQLGRTVGGVGGVRNYSVAAPVVDTVFTVSSTVCQVAVPGTISVSLA